MRPPRRVPARAERDRSVALAFQRTCARVANARMAHSLLRSEAMKHSLALTLVIPALGAILLAARPASACSPACAAPEPAPATSGAVPTDRGIPIWQVDASGFELLDAEGAAIAGTILPSHGAWAPRFVPDLPLTTGASYTARLASSSCGDLVGERTFTVAPAGAAPSAVGALSVASTTRGPRTVGNDASCSRTASDVVSVELALAMDPTLAPYAPIVTWTTFVDEKVWTSSNGTLTPVPGVMKAYRVPLSLYGSCGDDPGFGAAGLAPGSHEVKLRAYLPGADAPLESAPLSITIDCGAGTSRPMTDAETTAPVGNPAAPSTNAEASEGGCSTSPLRSGGSLVTAALGALGALVARRRRR